LGSPHAHLHRDRTRSPPTSAPGLVSQPTCAPRLGPPPPTSALRLGSPAATSAPGLGSPRDHIGAGTGLIPRPHLCEDRGCECERRAVLQRPALQLGERVALLSSEWQRSLKQLDARASAITFGALARARCSATRSQPHRPKLQRGIRCPLARAQRQRTDNQIKGTDNRNKGTDNRNKGTDNRNKGTDNRNKITDIRNQGTDDRNSRR
jgi:hypothetical protein